MDDRNNDSTVVGYKKQQPLDWLRGQKMPSSSSLKKAAPYIFVSLLSFMLADLTATAFRSEMIPKAAVTTKKMNYETVPYKGRNDYNDILARNIFNSDGIIPDLETADSQIADTSGPARESNLPLNLVGTIVHANPGKSVATIEIKGGTPEKILPYIPNDDIEGLATLIKVDRKKIFIRNLSSGALEFVQIKDDSGLTFAKKQTVSASGPFQKEGDGVFAISKNDLEKQMNDLPTLLTQARAIPNLVGGRINGFKIVDIQEGSLFSKLVQPNDNILSVNGEPLDSAAKAMELYNALKSQSQVKLGIERDGKTITQTYNIR